MRVLVAPDSFKGSLNPNEVAEALADGWRRGRPTDDLRIIPLADGGEGTLEAIKASASDWQELPVHARDPLGRRLRATFLRRTDEGVVEMAVASGLSRVAPEERDALAASTLGTGQVIAAAIGLGVRRLTVGLGGSATTDGGAGLLVALGARFFNAAGADLTDGGGALAELQRVDFKGLADVLGEVHMTVASDVTNPLLGPQGAAATYGPQKGADPKQVAQLEANLTRYAGLVEAAMGREVRDEPGAGAAGGTGFGLLAIADRFASFAVRPGVDMVMELAGFDVALAEADVVLTGEGRIDEQTSFGKTAFGVSRRARMASVRCICFGGGATPEGIAALSELGAIVVPTIEQPQTVKAAMAAGAAPLIRAAERAARLVSVSETRQ